MHDGTNGRGLKIRILYYARSPLLVPFPPHAGEPQCITLCILGQSIPMLKAVVFISVPRLLPAVMNDVLYVF